LGTTRTTTAVRSQRVTINEVAAHARVSRQTVSNTLNYPERVRPDTLAKVRESIELLGYRPSAPSQQLRHQRAGAVGFELNVVGTTRNDVTLPFLVALAVAAPRHACHLVPFASGDARPMMGGYVDTVQRHLVDAFVLVDTHPGDPRPSWLSERSIPWVAFGRIWNDETATAWADVDGQAGTTAAVDHLVAQGYERIGFLGWPTGSAVGDDRRQGWAAATARHGIDVTPHVTCEQGIAEATAMAESLLDTVGRGGAVVCASDVLAIGVLHAALSRGWAVGPDLGLVGFDGSSSADMCGITTLAQPLDRIADHCLAVVHGLVDGDAPPTAGSLFEPHLIPGPSTIRNPKGMP
jgi:DNA-binding LacI/PurR family transcriptional regulator